MNNERKNQERVVKDPPQRTVSGSLVHFVWRLISIVLVLAGTIVLAGSVTAGVVYLKAKDYLETDIIPNAGFTLEDQRLNQTSFIYAYDKQAGDYVELQRLYAAENRVWAAYSDIPENMIYATVAIEDKRFFEHDGVDWRRTLAACANMFMGGDSTYGGSTLTQQLIKNLSNDKEVTVRRKLMEIFRALEFEKHYSKEEILEWYLNTVYFGEGAYGVRSAAQVYFGKSLEELTIKECACIVGITNNPSQNDPYLYPETNEKRTRTILHEMRSQGYLDDLSEQEYQQLLDEKLVFGAGEKEEQQNVSCPNCGYLGNVDSYASDGDYLTCPNCGEQFQYEAEKEDYYTYFEDQVVRDVIQDLMDEYGYTYDYASQVVTTGGFHIYATIDLDVQDVVDSVYENIENVPKTYSSQQMQSAIVVVDNESGDIVAMSGGVGEKQGSLTLNRATQSRLSPGSSIKPITVYGPALEYGVITPGSAYEDSAYMMLNGRQWPQNESRSYSGWMLVNDGLCQSLNTIAVKVLADLTPEKSYAFATEQMGFHNLVESEQINGQQFSDISLSPLGMGQLTHGITVREMANAYATFPNRGVFREARTYTKVVDSNGKVVLDNSQETHTAMSEHAAWYMTYMLRNAVLYGTGTPAQMSYTEVAGKTGTTSDNRDRWFAGYTANYTAVAWCGFDEPEEIHLVVNRNPALIMWKNVISVLQENLPYSKFTPPTDEQLVSVSICTHSGLRAGGACTAKTVQLFASDVPDEVCDGLDGENISVCKTNGETYLAGDYCQEYYDLTHSEGFQALKNGAGQLLSEIFKPNDMDTLNVDDEDEGLTELPEPCPFHTASVIDALKAAIEAAGEKEPAPTEPTEPSSSEPTEPSSSETQPPQPTEPSSSESVPTEPAPLSPDGRVGSDAWVQGGAKEMPNGARTGGAASLSGRGHTPLWRRMVGASQF